MKRSVLCALGMTALFTSLGQAAPSSWGIDSAHSRLTFGVKHMTVSTVRGAFGKFSGTVEVSNDDPTTASIQVTVDVASVDTLEPKRDEHLRSADFFDVANYPTMTFRSKKVERSGSELRITGDLTLRGVTREVVLTVDELTAPITDPWGNTRVGAHATAKIDRKEFGITWSKVMDNGGLVVGNEVSVAIDVELVKQKPAAAAPTR
ncbi:MAG: polyisoprenoid-binding protein [Thermoanaerobaculaceae bacterium]|nr:polyisoprenoid-binding protein [Thermoanaerobaculaceae bacterium]